MSHALDTWAGHVLILVAVVVITLVGYRQADARVSDVALETHTTLCAFKADLERRRHTLWEFRESGREIEGITRTDINRSLSAQRATLDSLSALDCS